MNVGAVYPVTELGGSTDAVATMAVALEEMGFEHILAYDHVLGAQRAPDRAMGGGFTEDDPFHDPFVFFAYLAGLTHRIRFMTGVLVLPQRQTALVARQAADVDLLSGGRLRLGVGVGWNHVEYEAMGMSFRTRGRRMDEQVELLRALWGQRVVTHDGRFDRVDRAGLNPRPPRRIPVWIAGMSEPAYRRAAAIGDGCLYAGELEQCLRGRSRVEEHLGASGRSVGRFEHGLLLHEPSARVSLAEQHHRWVDAGGTHLSVTSSGRGLRSVTDHLDHFAQVAAELRIDGLGSSGE